VLELAREEKVVWSHVTNHAQRERVRTAAHARRAPEERHHAISDRFNDQVIEVDHAQPVPILFSAGMIGVASEGLEQLNVPHDAEQIGDYTGLTPPGEPHEQGDSD
jgi:hypothetical protein